MRILIGLLFSVSLFAQPAVPIDTSYTLLWLSAQAGVTTGAGDSVTTWADQSPTGNNATQSTGGAKPVLVNSAVGGLKGILFDGSNDNMALGSAVYSASSSPISFFAIVRHDHATFDNYECIYSQGAGTIGQAMGLILGNASAVATKPAFVTDVWQPSGLESGIVLSDATDYLVAFTATTWSAHRTPANSVFAVNGTVGTDVAYAATNPGVLLTTTPKIGSFNTLAGSYFDGYIAEVVLMDTTLVENDRKKFENYLGDWKYTISGYSQQSTWTLIGTDTVTAALGRLATSGSDYVFWSDTMQTAVQ